MATFGQIAQGTRARKPIKLGFGRARISSETGEWLTDEGGTVTTLDVRPLNPIEYTEVVQRARDFAISKGIPDPHDGEEIYDDAKILHTLVLACIDNESPAIAPRPFFDGGFDQLHGTELLLPDHIAYLYEQQQQWQDECSPRFMKQTPGEFITAVMKTADGDSSFFVGARRGMQWHFTHTLAAAYRNLLMLRSPSSSDSTTPTKTAETAPE